MVMLAKKLDSKEKERIKYPIYIQPKYDGVRVLYRTFGRFDKGLYTRAHNVLHISTLLGELNKLPDGYIYDGELIFQGYERKKSNGLALKAQNRNLSTLEESSARIVLWDMVDSLNQTTYKERYLRLCSTLNLVKVDQELLSPAPTITCMNFGEIEDYYKDIRLGGGEGIVIKTTNHLYQHYSRSSDWLKWKNESTINLRIVEFEFGTGRNLDVCGAIICTSDDGKIKVRVGAGLTDVDRESIADGGYIGTIVNIKFNTIIRAEGRETYSLFLPTFNGFRPDLNTTGRLEDIQ